MFSSFLAQRLLILKHLQISKLILTPRLVLSAKTKSFAKIIHQGTSSYIDLMNSSITSVQRYGLMLIIYINI